MRKYLFIILISIFISFGVITFNNMNGYCADATLTLGQSASETLNGVGGAFSKFFDVGVGVDPVSITMNLSRIYDDINQGLYNKFGWDLEDGLQYIDSNVIDLDRAALNAIIYSISPELADVAGMIDGGYQLMKSDNAISNWVIGKVIDGTNTISEVIDNALVYFDDSTIDKLTSVKEDLLEDQAIINFSELNGFAYGSKFRLYYSDSSFTQVDNVEFDHNIVVCTLNLTSPSVYAISDTPFNESFSANGTRLLNTSTYSINGAYISSSESGGTFVLSGKTYYYGPLYIQASYGAGAAYSSVPYGSISDAVNFVSATDLDSIASAYNNNAIGQSALTDLLDRLRGHWVTTDQLDGIIDIINDLAIDAVIDDSEGVPVIDWNQDIVDSLSAVIEQILEDNAVIDDSLGVDPDPDPPINNSNQGISVFPDFPIPVLDNFTTILGMPTQFFSIFRPLFLVFGSYFSSLWSFWLFIPSCVVIGFIIWLIH